MRHFRFLTADDENRIFHTPPTAFDRTSERMDLAYALGATLYMPATRAGLGKELVRRAAEGLTSSVLCLEDAVGDHDLAGAKENLSRELDVVADFVGEELPLLFVRVRAPSMLRDLCRELGPRTRLLSGFVLPKFSSVNAHAYLDAITEAGQASQSTLYALPILESAAILYKEHRAQELAVLQRLAREREEQILCVRIGGTDLSGLLGLRRSAEMAIYDLAPLRDLISDIVNTFARTGREHVITAPVWEYFSREQRVFKPQLRQSPFDEHGHQGSRLRSDLISANLDGLIREVLLDRANGLTGKTVIHPSHVRAVNALNVVSHEEYEDARSIRDTAGGVSSSPYGNKMNEASPHREWAARVLRRARLFGVFQPDRSFIDLLEV